ncbi:MAG: hypothetical protein JWR14_3976 [Caballeronia sp.]|jgi:hypothetical protein|uniref:hypothetical protein n=1 Tax=Caballeronia sp. TaxID=1931223 RepID=UPI002606C73B|nr:hypothetical protein [Caballeronia sp.]MDB5834146.1 hypothetical protein [Caballeronia sp.]
MPYTPPIKSMTPAQQQQMLAIAEVGLHWISGKIDFEEVKRMYGEPKRHWVDNEIGYAYFPGSFLAAEFYFDKDRLIGGQAVVKRFVLTVNTYFEPHIHMLDYETRLGLQRLVRGGKIDGVRVELGDFFNPGNRCAGCNPNNVMLGYRLPLSTDSPFDVNADFDYLGKHDAPDYASLRDPENLREITFTRTYLTPAELEQRRAARRQQYGLMDLRTGMLCPETAIWEGWTENGPTDATIVYAGKTFPTARNVPYENPIPYEWVDARWMWLRENPRQPWSES